MFPLLLLTTIPPARDETGACYALDIGGTNFRTVYYKLSSEHGKVVRSGLMPAAAAVGR
jgi:hexokinase